MVMDRPGQHENWKNPERPAILPLLLTPREAAKALRISERTLYTLTKEGKIEAVRPSKGLKRYSPIELERYRASLSQRTENHLSGRA